MTPASLRSPQQSSVVRPADAGTPASTSSDRRPTTVQQLPDDIVLRILETVVDAKPSSQRGASRPDSSAAFLSAALINRLWFKIAGASLSRAEVCYEPWAEEPVLIKELRQYTSLRAMDISSVDSLSPAFLHAAATHWPRLESLSISNVDVTENFGADEGLLRAALGSIKGLEFSLVDEEWDSFWSDQNSDFPTWILTLTQLTSLSMHCDEVSRLGEQFCTSFPGLKLLRIKSRRLASLPASLAAMTSLEALEIHGHDGVYYYDTPPPEALAELPEGLGELQALKLLHLSGLPYLQNLPDSISSLSSLTCLKIRRCPKFYRFPGDLGWGIASLTGLRTLAICSESLVRLPEDLFALSQLRTFLLDCKRLVSLPESVGDLRSLRKLVVAGWGELDPIDFSYGCRQELPESMGKLEHLEHLEVREIALLRELPGSAGKLRCLKTLCLRNCQALNHLPDSIGALQCLQELHIQSCPRLVDIPTAVTNIPGLTKLHLEGCSALIDVPLSSAWQLEELAVIQCSSRNRGTPKGTPSLAHATLKGEPVAEDEGVRWGGSVGSMVLSCFDAECFGVLLFRCNVKLLELRACSVSEHWWQLPESLSQLVGLRTLDLSNSECAVEVPESLSSLTGLEQLRLREHAQVLFNQTLVSLPNLERHCKADLEQRTRDLMGLRSWCRPWVPGSWSTLPGLEQVTIVGFRGQSLSDSVSALQRLQQLTIRDSTCIKLIPESVTSITGLTSLRLDSCVALERIVLSPLWRLRELALLRFPTARHLARALRVHALATHALATHAAEGSSRRAEMCEAETLEVSCEGTACIRELLACVSGVRRLKVHSCAGAPCDLHLPSTVNLLAGLRSLDLRQCSCAVELPQSLTSLRALEHLRLKKGIEIRFPEALVGLPNLDQQSWLELRSRATKLMRAKK